MKEREKDREDVSVKSWLGKGPCALANKKAVFHTMLRGDDRYSTCEGPNHSIKSKHGGRKEGVSRGIFFSEASLAVTLHSLLSRTSSAATIEARDGS